MTETNQAPRPQHGNMGLLLDFGPLLIFFLAYKFVGIIAGTAAFMAAIVIAVIISKVRLGKVSPMLRSEEHTSELQSLMRTSYAVFCLKKNTKNSPNLSSDCKRQ